MVRVDKMNDSRYPRTLRLLLVVVTVILWCLTWVGALLALVHHLAIPWITQTYSNAVAVPIQWRPGLIDLLATTYTWEGLAFGIIIGGAISAATWKHLRPRCSW